ncbi:MAG: winged helix-turn-helix domain-containing protein [Oscillospiraceae bacterium]|nr:winged helix-turn-helix domain-containing protein [Oscillospiraceae bacterium]MCR5167526.1 winged helix-turn-helix domain-containing protein [Oscillospiraceae bacterium]
MNEIYSEVISKLNLSEQIMDFQHSEKSSQTEIQYRLCWARTYLKIYGITRSPEM